MTKIFERNNHGSIKHRIATHQEFQTRSVVEGLLTHVEALDNTTREFLKKNIHKKLFAHIHLDHAIRGTLLEGGSTKINAEYLYHCLDVLDVPIEKKRLLQAALHSLTSSIDARDVEKKVQRLMPGDSLLVDGGYKDSSGGHAVLYEFYRKPNFNYDVYLYNTGEGSGQYHPKIQKEATVFYKAVIKFENVFPEELGLSNQNTKNSPFFQYLSELKNPEKMEKKNISLLYEKGFGHLSSKLVTVKDDDSLFIKGQHSGTCSWRVLHAFVLKSFCDSGLYKKYVFDLKLVTLALFFKKCEAKHDLESCMLLEEAVTNLLRAAAKLLEAQVLSEKRAACVYTTLQEILREIELLKARCKTYQSKQERTTRQNFFFAKSNDGKLPISSIQSSSAPLLFSVVEPVNFLRDICKIMDHIKLLSTVESKVFQIENFAEALPIPHADITKDPWQNLPENDLHSGLSLIQTVTEIYGDLCLDTAPFFPCQQNTALILFAIAHRLSLRIDQRQSGTLTNYGFWNAIFSDEDKKRFFICLEPKQQQRRRELQVYFSTINKNKRPLFNFPLLEGNQKNVHENAEEISCFKKAIDQDPVLENQLTKQAHKLGKEKRLSFTLSSEVLREVVLLIDNEWLAKFDQTRHFAFLRNIAYITQQFSGWGIDKKPKSKKYQCYINEHVFGRVEYSSSCWKKTQERKLDPALGFHLLPSKDQMNSLVTELASFSSSLFEIAHETESKILLVPEKSSLQYQKQLETTQCEPYLQPQKLLYYFQEHLEELTDLNKQALFDIIFFKQINQETPLFKELQTNPFFAEHCTLFIRDGLDRFSQEKSGDSNYFFAYLFFVRLLYRINQIQEDLQLTAIGLLAQNTLQCWLENANLSLEDKACLHLHRMMQYAYLPNDKISAQHLQEIIPSWFFYNRSHVLEKQMPYLEKQASTFIHRIAPCMEKLTQEQQKQMVNNVLQITGIANTQEEVCLQLSSQFPFYTMTYANQDFWKMHVLTTQIANRKGLIESASTKELRTFKDYRDLFEDRVFNIYKADGYYCFVCPEKGQIRIYKEKRQGDCRIECLIEKSWYQYIPETTLIQTKLPFVLIEGHWHWYSTERNEMLIISKKHNEVVAKVHIRNYQNQGFLDLLQIENKQQERILYPTESLDPYIACVDRIELRDWMLIFQDAHKKYTHICFPRLHSLQEKQLKFIFTDSGQMQLIGEQHFVIAQHIPRLIGHMENYLILEDKKHNKKKVLVPVQEMKESKHFSPESMALDFTCTKKDCSLELQKFTYLEFELKDNQISPMNREGVVYLAYLYLAQKEYVKALKYLEQIVKADVLSELSSTILHKFFNLPALNQDQHPTACAIRLKALFLLQSKSNEKIEVDLKQDYSIYNVRIANVDSRAILSLEEKEYYSALFSIPPFDPYDFLQKWENTSLFHSSLPLKEIKFIGNLRSSSDSTSKSYIFDGNISYEKDVFIGSIFTDSSFLELYEQARNAKSEQDRLLISTQLHFSKNKQLINKIIHFVLKYPKLVPAVSSLTKEGLNQLLKDYKRKYEAQEHSSLKPTLCTASEDPIFRQKNLLQRLRHSSPFRVCMQQALILSHIEPENRCFPISFLADACFSQIDTGYKMRSGGFSLEKITKEDYKQAIEQQYEDFVKDLKIGALINQNSREFRLKQSEKNRIATELHAFLQPDILQVQRQKILDLANVKPREIALYNDLLEQGRFRSRVDLKQLVCAFLRGDANEYYALNSYLSMQEIQEIDRLLQKFMLESIKQCQVQRALILLESLEKAEDTTSVEQELYTVLKEEMSYDPKDRVLLVYEYQAKIRVRQNQAKLISEMTAISETGEYKNLITQLIMGGGKTSVLASILLVILAKPDRLAVFIPPATQFDTLRNNLKVTQHRYFLQELIPIDLTRSEFSVSRLEDVYKKLTQAQEKRWAILIKKETIQSFALELQSCLHKAQELEKIAILHKIVQVFRRSGHAILDECDLQLTPMQEVNFSIGEKKQIDPMYITCGMEIFKLLLSQHRIHDQSQSIGDFIGLSQNAQSLMKTEDYYKQVLPVVAKELFISYKNILLLSEEHCSSFLKYVQGTLNNSELTPQEEQFLALLRSYASSNEKEEKEAAALAAWIKAQCTEILPLTLAKDTNRHYGRANTKELGKVVPYKGVNSPSTTQFGSPWEALAYQFQTAVSQKLSIDLIKTYVQKTYQAAENYALYAQIPFESTKEAKNFLDLTGSSLSEINNENFLKQIQQNINRDPSKILEVEADLAASLIHYHPFYLNSNASHLFAQFASVTGFSGTPWNSSCYPQELAKNVLFDQGTEGKIVDIACQKAEKNPHVIHLIQNTEIQEMLNVCFQNNPRRDLIKAFIDVAGLFKDYDNLHTAKQIIHFFENSSQITCVLFFGRSSPQESAPNTLMALRKGNPDPIVIGSTRVEELKKQGIDPESTFIYYDECHCEATDLPQIKHAVNLLSSNASMILRDLLQGMLRAREYLKSQDIEYVVHENTVKQLGIRGKPTFEKIVLNPAIVNQAERKAKETYRAFSHEIDHVLFQCAWEDVLSESSPSGMIERFKKYCTLFLHNSEIDPFKQYGNPLQKDFGLTTLKNHAQKRLQHWKQIQPLPLLQKKVEEGLAQVIQKAATCNFLPNLVELVSPELGKELQVEMEQEVEQEVNVEIEEELESYQFKGEVIPREESTWSSNAIASKIFLAEIRRKVPKRAENSKIPKTYSLAGFIESYSHCKPYHEIFEEQDIIITENAIYTSCDLYSIFSNAQKPAHQILIVKEHKKTYAVILSIKEAKAFKEHLSHYKPKDMWLILPNANKLSLPETSKSHSNLQQEMLEHADADWLARTLWFINFFNGDMSYLLAHADLTRKIFTEKNTELKKHFIELKTTQDPKQKPLFDYLLQHVLEDRSKDKKLQVQQHYLERETVKARVECLTNQEIAQLSQKDREYLPFLNPEKICYIKEPSLIQSLSGSQVKEVIPSQVPYLLVFQVRFLTKPEQIQSACKEQIEGLLPLQLNHLKATQVAYLSDDKIQYLEQPLTQKIDANRICLLYREKNLLNSQLKWLSKVQLRALLQENDIQDILHHLDNKQLSYIEKKEQIQAIPLYSVQHLTKDQFPFLTLDQSYQVSDQYYKCLNTEQFRHKYKNSSMIFMLLKGCFLWNLRILAYICGVYLLKRIAFTHFLNVITNILDRSNMHLGIGYRMLRGK